MSTKTAIEYTYRKTSRIYARSQSEGPFYFRDDGRDPVDQARERCAKYGDAVVSATRVDVSEWKSTETISR